MRVINIHALNGDLLAWYVVWIFVYLYFYVNFCVLQIKSFIENLNLSGKSSVEEKQQPGHLLDENGSSKEDKKAKTMESEALSKKDRNARKKKDIKRGRSVFEEEHIDKEISNQLLHLSVKSYKRLLVSADSEVIWYDQVSPHYSLHTWEQNVNVLFRLCLTQAQSSKPACPVEDGVIEYLLQVGESLMKNEVQTYEQGECAVLQ